MGKEVEISTQTLDSSPETNEIRFRQEQGMNSTVDEARADELTLRLVEERIK